MAYASFLVPVSIGFFDFSKTLAHRYLAFETHIKLERLFNVAIPSRLIFYQFSVIKSMFLHILSVDPLIIPDKRRFCLIAD